MRRGKSLGPRQQFGPIARVRVEEQKRHRKALKLVLRIDKEAKPVLSVRLIVGRH